MDKKHASCISLHSRRNVKLLIEKFEGMCDCQAKKADSRPEWHPQSLVGRVAGMVAKFENNCILGHRCAKQTSGDQLAECCLAEWKLKISQWAQPTVDALQTEEQSRLPQAQQDEHMDMIESDPRLAINCSSFSIYNQNLDISNMPSFNGFDICDEECLFVRPSLSCTW